MLTHFPIAQKGELLGSILARFIEQQGISDDKIALQWLFGNRKVVPSSLLQGHIRELYEHVGHIWQSTPEKIIYEHTIFPLFAPFSPPQHYNKILNNLINGSTNTSSLTTGMNTSLLIWPDTYQVCPICMNEQKKHVGYYYINRLFQCAGVESCPKHHCLLVKTSLNVHSDRRHRFVGLPKLIEHKSVVQVASSKLNRLSSLVEELLEYSGKTYSCEQCTCYYQNLVQTKNLKYGNRIDHDQESRIKNQGSNSKLLG